MTAVPPPRSVWHDPDGSLRVEYAQREAPPSGSAGGEAFALTGAAASVALDDSQISPQAKAENRAGDPAREGQEWWARQGWTGVFLDDAQTMALIARLRAVHGIQDSPRLVDVERRTADGRVYTEKVRAGSAEAWAQIDRAEAEKRALARQAEAAGRIRMGRFAGQVW